MYERVMKKLSFRSENKKRCQDEGKYAEKNLIKA